MEKNLSRASFCAELSNLNILCLPDQEQKLDNMVKVLLTQSTSSDSTVALTRLVSTKRNVLEESTRFSATGTSSESTSN
jgi:hypothetical protein